MKPRLTTRRDLMKRAAAGVAGAALVRSVSPSLGALGANERLNIGFIGTGGQGLVHVRECREFKDVAIVAICDVDTSRREEGAKLANSSPRKFEDFRELLSMKEVDAVLIATPDHWHGIAAIHACQAGKDIYVEKPLAYNVREGRALVEAVKKYDRISMVGTQQRSGGHWLNAVNRIKAGEIGKVSLVHAWNAWNPREMGGDLGNPEDCDTPPGLNYDMWLGPAPKRQFNWSRYGFHACFYWDYGGGMLSSWGVHLFDIVAWAMGPEIQSVSTVGGKYVFKDCRETPDTAVAAFECPGYELTYTIRHGNGWRPNGDLDHGIEFFGTTGTLHINRMGFQIQRDEDRGPRKASYKEGPEGGWDFSLPNHKKRFFECVRTRKKTNADVEIGHQSAIFGHLANISYRVGRRIRWDSKTESIPDDREATALLTREPRAPWHL